MWVYPAGDTKPRIRACESGAQRPALIPSSYVATRRVTRAMAVATTATAAATETCRVVPAVVRRSAPHCGHRWTELWTGSLQFGQRVRTMAPPGGGTGMLREPRKSIPNKRSTVPKVTGPCHGAVVGA